MTRKSFRIARIAILAALYIVLSLVIYPLSYGAIQIRLAEMLVLICFFNRDYCYSMILGCAIVNCFSPLGIIDVVFGTIGTLLSVVGIRYTRRMYLAWIPPTICSFMVALEFLVLEEAPFWITFGTIALGEFLAVGVIGTPIFMLLSKRMKFLELIDADNRYFKICERITLNKKNRRAKLDAKNNDKNASIDINDSNIQPDNSDIDSKNMNN